ncbi:MAG TPA: energy transducer TonB [Pyrinomonadaceae bacterium]|nr:energy transducer TonB [Pyrinomonadaceae bacterium]
MFCPVDGSALSNGATAPAAEPFAADEPSLFADAPAQPPRVTEQTVAAAAADDSAARAARVEPQTAATAAASSDAPAASGTHFAAASGHIAGNGSPDTEQTVVTSSAAREREEYRLTMLQDDGLTQRLRRELGEVARESQLTWPEFKKDPMGFAERTAIGYGLLAKKFFRQPYVPASILAGVLGMALAVTLLVFPFKTVYKWFMSDGQLVADVGMSLGDVRQRSSLKMGDPVVAAPDAQVGGEEGSTVATLSGDNLGFDFGLGSTGLKFEWARAYRIVLENDRVREINVEVSSKPQTWQQLRATAVTLADFLEDRRWRSGRTESGVTQAAILKARFMDAPPAELQQPDVREFLWRDEDNLRQLTFTASPLQEGVDPKQATYSVYLKVEEIPADMIATMIDIPKEQPEPDEGTAGTAKGKGGGAKPKQEKAGGGGGGGRQEQLPASYGKLPPAERLPQIVAVSPTPSPVKNASLPVLPHIVGDSVIMPTDTRNIPFGDPKSTSTTPSSGPGEGRGIGDGKGSGVGSGDGRGFGPGEGENTGGGATNYGGGGPGGGGGGREVDYNRTFQSREVTRKAVITSKPEPGFTEEARKNQVTGTVRIKMVLGANGSVSNISVVKGLPDGLTERAIAAARRIQFQPAQKDGRPVSQWITIEYSFNIY